MNNIITSGTSQSMVPLIMFDTIVDTDIGLLYLIYNEYLDGTVFNKELWEKPIDEILNIIYYRKTKNPLIPFSIIDDIQELDSLYDDFINKRYIDILWKSVTTEMYNLVKLFLETSEIVVYIGYRNELEKEIIDSDPVLSKVTSININSLSKEDLYKNFKQYYCKYIEDLLLFDDDNCAGKTIYLSTIRSNFNENNDDLRETNYLQNIVKRMNQISLFDLYKKEYITKGN